MTDGQLNLDFQGENWACSVSAVVIFPVAKAAEGERFLKYVDAAAVLLRQLLQARPARATGDATRPVRDLDARLPTDSRRGYVVFPRDCMARRVLQRHARGREERHRSGAAVRLGGRD